MKKYHLFLFVCLAVVLLSVACTACSKPAGSPAPEKPRALLATELEYYAVSKNIKLLATKNTDEWTIIMAQQQNDVLIYAITRDENGEVQESSAASYKSTSGDQRPADVITLAFYAERVVLSFAAVTINDPELQKRAHKIVIRLSNGDELSELVDDEKAHILVDEGVKVPETRFEAVMLFDRKERNIY